MSSSSSPTSLWQLKPWWCQPWSIVLTGVAVPVGVWLLFHRLWLVVPVGAVIVLWWTVFLYLVPRQYAAERDSIPPANLLRDNE
ncbi:MAG: DUF6737 family protein [Cyanobacteria bacterium P01_A01_bin.105]